MKKGGRGEEERKMEKQERKVEESNWIVMASASFCS